MRTDKPGGSIDSSFYCPDCKVTFLWRVLEGAYQAHELYYCENCEMVFFRNHYTGEWTIKTDLDYSFFSIEQIEEIKKERITSEW
jgi:ribosomal protein L37AE/L43A